MVLCAIGRHGVFSLGGWSPRFPTEFLVLRGTLDPGRLLVAFVYGALTLSRLPFQVILLATRRFPPVRNPPLRSPLLWASRLISLPPAT